MDDTTESKALASPEAVATTPNGSPAVVGGDAADSGTVGGTVSEPHGSIPILPAAGREDWKSFRHSLGPNDSIEVFISPEGHWYKRCGKSDTPELRVPAKTKGLPMSYLVCIDHWRDEQERLTGEATLQAKTAGL